MAFFVFYTNGCFGRDEILRIMEVVFFIIGRILYYSVIMTVNLLFYTS